MTRASIARRKAAVRAPQQARSAQTHRRLLDAAETLLEENSFDDTSVAEIAARAGVTVGAFYARFPDKAALLRHLEDRLHEEFVLLVDRDVDPARWKGKAMEQALLAHYRELVALYTRRRAAARALVLRSHTDPALRQRLDALNLHNMPRICQLLARHARIKHPNPELAVQFAMFATRSVCREAILFRQGWPEAKLPAQKRLAEELTRLVLGYLGHSAASPA